MPPPVYTKRLAGLQGAGGGWHPLFTAGPGTTVIRSLVFCNVSGTPGLTDIAVIPRTKLSAYYLFWNGSVAANSTVVLEMRQALAEGDLVQLESAVGSWSCCVTGYVFDS